MTKSVKRLSEAQLDRIARKFAQQQKPDGFAETRAQLDELAQVAEGSHRQHMERDNG